MLVKALLNRTLKLSEVEAQIAKLPKEALGSYGYDAWGYNLSEAKYAYAALKLIHDKYFRVKAYGLENIPKNGRALVIPNHSGQIPTDGMLIGVSLINNPHAPRTPRAMIERFFPTVPFLGNLLNATGAVIGDPVNCAKMLEKDEAIIVFPEGIRGSGKPYKKRYTLQRFGNGFMHLAMTHKAPIIPVGVVGCEETMPSLGSLDPLAKRLGIPYIPITLPWLLPAKVSLHFGKPMYFDGDVNSEEQVTQQVEAVKAEIRKLIAQGLEKRQGVFL